VLAVLLVAMFYQAWAAGRNERRPAVG